MQIFRRLERALTAPWVWPTALLVFGLAAVASAIIVSPIEGQEMCQVFGDTFGGPCAFEVQSGMPCPQCGMTRSWVWSVRGYVLKGAIYNPAGAILFWWLAAGGIVGAVRLATRDLRRLTLPWQALVSLTLVWMLIYGGGWILRVFGGVNPLP